ncbi:MAG: T9SS type A sorting domain-containing protein [Melioribacteraceae bacterium]|nr:T9SS type A sorting domain-containing protein [Melioribacteraceae bacterium]WKZ70814.1 MAG: T9SS type A sorting domain-containing protein [Melioribacteraceae bacterium]
MKHTFHLLTISFLLVFNLSFAQYTSDEMIERGLEYLANSQTVLKSPGIASFSEMGSQLKSGPKSNSIMLAGGGYWTNTGITGLALQAFLAHGHGLDDPTYGTVVRNAVDYILSAQNRTVGNYEMGAIGHGFEVGYETAICMGALSSVLKLGVTNDSLRTEILNALDLALIYYTQDIDSSGWDYVSWRYNRSYFGQTSGDMSANQWVYLALFDTDYEGKDIWQKIYNYINDFSVQTETTAYLGYTPYSPGTWSRGNSMAAIWGLILADGFGITDAGVLVNKFYNWLELNSLSEIIDPASIGNHVYSGGGYHYYLYEFAKAMALGGRIQFLGSDWYTELETELSSRAIEPTPGQLYWDGSGGQGRPMETALAVLSLQSGTVPPGTKFTVGAFIRPTDADTSGVKQYNSVTADFEYQISIYDALGNFAGQDENGDWITTIPNSSWTSTTSPIEFEVNLTSAATFNIEVANTGDESIDFDLHYAAYQGGSTTPSSEKDYAGSIAPNESVGSTANINAIGGLSIFSTTPTALPVMQLSQTLWYVDPAENDSTYTLDLGIAEVGDSAALNSITVFASDLVDEYGNIIPKANYSITPTSIAKIDQGTSDTVSVSLTIPDSTSLDLSSVGLLKGTVTIQSSKSTKAIQVRVGRVFPSVALISPPNNASNVSTDIDFTWSGDEVLLATDPGGKGQNRVQAVSKYWFQLVTDTGTMDGLVQDSTLVDSSYSVNGLTSQQTYFWRVAGKNHFGWGAFSSWFSFTTVQSGALAAPLLISPENNSVDIILPHPLQWSTINNSDLYQLIIADDANFNTVLYNNLNIREGSYLILKTNTPDGKKMYWKVRAGTDAGATGPYSLTWNFTTYLPFPSDLVASSSQSDVAVDLSWVDNSNGENGFIIYRAVGFDVSNDQLFSAIDTVGANQTIYTDSEVMENTPYTYKITALTDDVESDESNISSASTITGLKEEGLPTEYTLYQNYPNPFNPSTTIRFALPFASSVRLEVYNLLGQKVATLLDGNENAGYHKLEFNAKNLASGIYFYTIKANSIEGDNEFRDVKKFMLMK